MRKALSPTHAAPAQAGKGNCSVGASFHILAEASTLADITEQRT